MSRDTLLVFLKNPVPGTVKTRLIPALGAETAADLYRVLAGQALQGTRPRGDEYERLLFFAPPDARAGVESWLPGETCLPQAEGDLGQRMLAAFEEAFRRGSKRVAVMGSDVPWISRDHVIRAFGLLERRDVVLGPALDGGYYVLGLSGPHPALFHDIPWSTSAVLSATTAKAARHGLSLGLLDPLPDIDTIDDIRREWDRLRPLLAGTALEARVAEALDHARYSSTTRT
jgi:rSAM/selenodomain-associated transferase 1